MAQLKNSTLSSGDIHSADTVISPGKCSPVLLLLINSFLYISVALYSPFLSAYYRQNGITSSQIGILMTVAPLASVIIQPFWAKRSDESGKAKKYVCAIILGIIVSLYTFYLGHSFTTFLIASILLALFSTSVNPMIDAIVIRNANYFQYNFAIIRMGGTVGYAVIVLLVGVYLRKNPSAQFNLKRYLEEYPEIKKMGLNPLVHYIDNDHEGFTLEENPFVARRKKILDTNSLFLADYSFDSEPLVSIIILNRNGLGHLQRLFGDFDKKTNYSNYEIIVVDNASCDKSVEYLHSLNLPIRVIENSENVSFSKGNNDAAKIANGEYLILLNNDIEPTYGWLNEMVGTALNNENVGSVGAKLIFPYYEDMKNQGKSFSIQHAGVKFREERTPYIYGPYHEHMYSTMLFSDELNHQKEVISNTAACLLVPKDVYFELDGLDEQYIYGYEDIDFAFKLYNAGYKTLYNPAVLLFHHESATRHEDDDWKNQLNYHNIMHFADKWGDFIFKEILKDKIEANNFFTNKKLDFTIVGKNNDLIKKAVFKLNSEGYNVKLVPNIGDLDIGQDCDILISTEKEYDIKNVSSRLNLIKILISDEDNDGYDMVLSENDFEFNLLDKIKEKYL
jgi:GT2 family glycosyltransferase